MNTATATTETMSPEELSEAYEAYGDYREDFDTSIREGLRSGFAEPKTFSQFIRGGQ